MKKIIIAGGNGFLGKSFIQYLNKDYSGEIYVLSRTEIADHDNVHYLQWDGINMDTWQYCLENADVLLNLAGKSVNCRYNSSNMQGILESRTKSTAVLGKAIQACKNPPKLWINMSTATIYRDEYVQKNTEQKGIIGEGFSVNVAKKWEEIFFNIPLKKTRKIAIRTAIAFGKDGDVFKIYRNHVKMYISGKHGHGQQWVSWIHEEDFFRAIMFLIRQENLEDVFNLASPTAIRDHDMMRLFREKLGYKFGLPTTKWMLFVGAYFLRTETELILKSRWVYPERLLAHGFKFKYHEMDEALSEMLERA